MRCRIMLQQVLLGRYFNHSDPKQILVLTRQRLTTRQHEGTPASSVRKCDRSFIREHKESRTAMSNTIYT
ncbi:uncharacterized [Tachysurus ichikawai]